VSGPKDYTKNPSVPLSTNVSREQNSIKLVLKDYSTNGKIMTIITRTISLVKRHRKGCLKASLKGTSEVGHL
jgi:hypothetical protein